MAGVQLGENQGSVKTEQPAGALCPKCGRVMNGALACAHCGHRNWVPFSVLLVGGCVCVAIGLWLCKPGVWRGCWLNYGSVAVVTSPMMFPAAKRNKVLGIVSGVLMFACMIAGGLWLCKLGGWHWIWVSAGSIWAALPIVIACKTALQWKRANSSRKTQDVGQVTILPRGAEIGVLKPEAAAGEQKATVPRNAMVPPSRSGADLAREIRRLHERMAVLPEKTGSRQRVTGAGAGTLRKELDGACIVLAHTATALESGVDPRGDHISQEQIAGNLSRFMDMLKSSGYQHRLWMLLGREGLGEFNEVVEDLQRVIGEISMN